LALTHILFNSKSIVNLGMKSTNDCWLRIVGTSSVYNKSLVTFKVRWHESSIAKAASQYSAI